MMRELERGKAEVQEEEEDNRIPSGKDQAYEWLQITHLLLYLAGIHLISLFCSVQTAVGFSSGHSALP